MSISETCEPRCTSSAAGWVRHGFGLVFSFPSSKHLKMSSSSLGSWTKSFKNRIWCRNQYCKSSYSTGFSKTTWKQFLFLFFWVLTGNCSWFPFGGRPSDGRGGHQGWNTAYCGKDGSGPVLRRERCWLHLRWRPSSRLVTVFCYIVLRVRRNHFHCSNRFRNLCSFRTLPVN